MKIEGKITARHLKVVALESGQRVEFDDLDVESLELVMPNATVIVKTDKDASGLVIRWAEV